MVLTGERMILNRMRKETEIEHICRYEYAKYFVEGKKVLDAACGSGYGTSILAENAENVVGMDISPEAIQYATENYKKDNLGYLTGSVEKLPFDDNTFDVVVSFETIEHVNEDIQKSFLHEIERVLNEDGILIMSTPNKKIFTDERSGGKSSEYHIKEFYADEFKEFLKRKFRYVEFMQQFYAKTACIVEKKCRLAELHGFEEDGMYIVAIASNKELKSQNMNSFLVRYPRGYEDYNDYLQVFYSSGEPYSEEYSQIVEFDNRNIEQKIHVIMDGVVCSKLRIDPISRVGSVKIHLIEIGLAGGTTEVITNYTTNAIEQNEGEYISDDLQIYIDFNEEKNIQYVNVIYEIQKDKKIIDLLRKVNEEKELLLGERQILMGEKEILMGEKEILMGEKEILMGEKEILLGEKNSLDEHGRILQEEITNIKNSKTWKLMQMIGKILHGK